MKQEVNEKIDTETVRFVTTKEAMKIMCCSRPAASRAIHLTNERLKKQGCYVMRGRCNRQAFLKRWAIADAERMNDYEKTDC